MIYFRGCVVREKLPRISIATETILKRADVDYKLIENETCCGSFLMNTGFKDDAVEVMEKNLHEINKIKGPDEKIVVSCAGCYNTLKHDYKEILGVELEVLHISELLNQLIAGGKLKIKETHKNLTYHDPCHLGRHSDIYEEPRKVIEKTGNLIEMQGNRERSRCCGAGAGVKSAFPETSLEVAYNRIDDAEDTGAELLITTCSFCILNLENALEKRNNPINNNRNDSKITDNENNKDNKKHISGVLDLSELILMGLEDEEV
jgi:Fe-S oxidoreductase